MLQIAIDIHLFVKVPRPGDSEGPFRSLSKAATCYYQSNHSKVEAFRLVPCCPRTQQANLPVSTLYFLMLNVKQGSCELPTF